MANRYDFGIRDDFNNMTKELATQITVAPRSIVATYEGQESEQSNDGTPVTEYASIVVLDEKNEVVASGEFSVGDLRVTFQDNSTVEEESKIVWDSQNYKIINLKRPKGLQNNITTYITGYGKRITNR